MSSVRILLITLEKHLWQPAPPVLWNVKVALQSLGRIPAKSATTTATRPSSNATDDEILGLTTNIRRKNSTESQRRAGADAATQDQSEVSHSRAASDASD